MLALMFNINLLEFTSNVIVHNGQIYEAKLNLPHCPGNAGCRSVIMLPEGSNQFSLEENFMLSFKVCICIYFIFCLSYIRHLLLISKFFLQKPDNKSLWLDYLLVIPADQFSESLLEEKPIDQTSAFISQCGNNHFDISPNTTGAL